jgi:hypothetical protein
MVQLRFAQLISLKAVLNLELLLTLRQLTRRLGTLPANAEAQV